MNQVLARLRRVEDIIHQQGKDSPLVRQEGTQNGARQSECPMTN